MLLHLAVTETTGTSDCLSQNKMRVVDLKNAQAKVAFQNGKKRVPERMNGGKCETHEVKGHVRYEIKQKGKNYIIASHCIYYAGRDWSTTQFQQLSCTTLEKTLFELI